MPSAFDEHDADKPDQNHSDESVAEVRREGLHVGVNIDTQKRRRAPRDKDPTQRSKIHVFTQDGAAELCIIDRTYALVATGVGKLDVSLPAGDYQLRQCIGDDEQIQLLTVLPGSGVQDVELPPLTFPSPIPLPGTTLAGPLGAEAIRVEKASGNFRVLLWTPNADLSPGDWKPARERIEAQLKRLRLEDFLTGTPQELSVAVPDENDLANSVSILVAMNLSPGPYVMIQQGSAGRQRCMPVWICPGFVSVLYMLVLQVDGEAVPLQLDHAAVALLPAEDFEKNYVSSLLKLESARKTLGAGRRTPGSVRVSAGLNEAVYIKNPLLSLMDAQLAVGGTSTHELDAFQSLADEAADSLGNDFPDVAALRLLKESAQTETKLDKLKLRGPPLLRRSWAQLLAKRKGNAALSELMDFEFQVDGNGTWLIWSEEKHSRQLRTRKAQGGGEPTPSDDAIFPPPHEGILHSFMSLVVNLIPKLLGRTSNGRTTGDEDLLGTQLKQVSFDKVVQILVVLADSELLQRLLDNGQQAVTEKGALISQDSMLQLVSSLQVFLDTTLVKAIGTETLVRQSLNSLKLPEDKIVGLIRSLMTLLLDNLSKQDQAMVMKALEGVFTVADTWLKVRDTMIVHATEANTNPPASKAHSSPYEDHGSTF
jgi:hypothetical protein